MVKAGPLYLKGGGLLREATVAKHQLQRFAGIADVKLCSVLGGGNLPLPALAKPPFHGRFVGCMAGVILQYETAENALFPKSKLVCPREPKTLLPCSRRVHRQSPPHHT